MPTNPRPDPPESKSPGKFPGQPGERPGVLSASHAIARFDHLIRLAMSRTGLASLTLGNVEFWHEGDTLCHSIPTSAWDVGAVNRELSAILSGKKSEEGEKTI